ncbi:MAG: DUF6602 domain-containing protein [Planctomycetota bacterium]
MKSAAVRLDAARVIIEHKLTRGIAAERVLMDMLQEFLPQRFGISTGFILDSQGKSSRQIDLLVFDQANSAPIYRDNSLAVVTPDMVRIVLEVKSRLDKARFTEALENISSAKSMDPKIRSLLFAFDGVRPKSLEGYVQSEKQRGATPIPDGIFVMQHQLFVFQQGQLYNGYRVGKMFTSHLISEVMSAVDVANLKPFLPGLPAGKLAFSV